MADVNDNLNQSVQKVRQALGRPRSFDLDGALDAAVATFLKHGYDGATLEHLTTAMEIGRPSLYAAFGDKRALFAQVLRRYGETIGSEPARAFVAAQDIRDAVAAFLTVAVENNTRENLPPGCLIACCAATAAVTQDDTGAFLRDVLAGARAVLAERFDAAVAAGELSPGTSSIVRATLLIDLMQGMALRARAGEQRQALLYDVEAFTACVCR